MSRQTIFTEELAEEICHRLIEGESLRKICAAESMPHRATVIRWMEANEDFATKCARARDAQAEYMDDLILDTANECTAENAQAAKVKISAYQWRASKLKPKKYGDRVTTELTGLDGGPIRVANSPDDLTDEQLAAIASAGRPTSTEPETGTS